MPTTGWPFCKNWVESVYIYVYFWCWKMKGKQRIRIIIHFLVLLTINPAKIKGCYLVITVGTRIWWWWWFSYQSKWKWIASFCSLMRSSYKFYLLHNLLLFFPFEFIIIFIITTVGLSGTVSSLFPILKTKKRKKKKKTFNLKLLESTRFSYPKLWILLVWGAKVAAFTVY